MESKKTYNGKIKILILVALSDAYFKITGDIWIW